MRGLTGKLNKDKRDPKWRAILKLKQAADLITPEQKLWFAVMEQAIHDLGKKFPIGSHYFFLRQHPMAMICDHLNMDPSFVFRTLKDCEVLWTRH